MSNTDVNDFILSGGVPAAKFPMIGTVVKGTIVGSDVQQQLDFDTGKPKFFDDGKPMMQAVITLQTDDRDPSIDGDEGLRRVFVRGQMTAAVREALRTAGAKLEVGGTLAVQFTEEKVNPEKPHRKPAKQYVAQYKPPAAGTAATNDLLGTSSAAPAAAQPPTAASLID